MSARERRKSLAWLAAGAATLLAGCAGVVDKPQRPVLFDMGPLPVPPSPERTGARVPPLVIPEIEAWGALESSVVLYRLGYADDHQLRAYALSRWSAPPPQLLRQRLRERLGRDRAVLNQDEGASIPRGQDNPVQTLRLELEEFAHVFDAPNRSRGVLRLRATLLTSSPAGDVLLGQRSIATESAAPTLDASGGVRALTAAADAAAASISAWLQQVTPPR
jgi:cholesterol transport system auxiliary component